MTDTKDMDMPPGLRNFAIHASRKKVQAADAKAFMPVCYACIQGLPNELLTKAMLTVVLEQAGLMEEDVLSRSPTFGKRTGKVEVGLASKEAGERCIRHFTSCQWSGIRVTVELRMEQEHARQDDQHLLQAISADFPDLRVKFAQMEASANWAPRAVNCKSGDFQEHAGVASKGSRTLPPVKRMPALSSPRFITTPLSKIPLPPGLVSTYPFDEPAKGPTMSKGSDCSDASTEVGEPEVEEDSKTPHA